MCEHWLLLQGLLRRKYLERVGRGRGCSYRIAQPEAPTSPGTPAANSEHYAGNSEHYATSSEHYADTSEQTDVIALQDLPSVQVVRASGRAPSDQICAAILDACRGRYLALPVLAELLNRKADTLRTHYLRSLLDTGRLEMRYPSAPNHPSQAYRTTKQPHPAMRPPPKR